MTSLQVWIVDSRPSITFAPATASRSFRASASPPSGFLAQSPHQFGQILVGHRQLDSLAVVVPRPAEVVEELRRSAVA